MRLIYHTLVYLAGVLSEGILQEFCPFKKHIIASIFQQGGQNSSNIGSANKEDIWPGSWQTYLCSHTGSKSIPELELGSRTYFHTEIRGTDLWRIIDEVVIVEVMILKLDWVGHDWRGNDWGGNDWLSSNTLLSSFSFAMISYWACTILIWF